MPFTIRDLIEGCPPPVCVKQMDSIHQALDLMIKHDFSQLPVVDDAGKPLGMVTSDSILRTLKHFGATIGAVRVMDAMTKDVRRRDDADLFEMLNVLRDIGAVLIVDGEGRLIGIVTHYDTTEYFRRRAEDIMLVEDIESAIKGHIEAAYTDPSTAEIDQAALSSTVADITDTSKSSKARFIAALRRYLELQGSSPQVVQGSVDEAFPLLESKGPPKAFEDLTLYDYIGLLLHPTRADYYSRVFDLEQSALRNLLDSVRTTRNTLAHFRGEISASQRDQLRFCVTWLERHPAVLPVAWPVYETTQRMETKISGEHEDTETILVSDVKVTPTEEELGPQDSRYAPLAIWLYSRPPVEDRVQLDFHEVADIIEEELPESAYTHRAWWANDSVGHVQSQQWLDAGWRVAQINMTDEKVTFARIRERETAYIDFFSALLTRMRKKAGFPLRYLSPDGASWHTAVSLPENGTKCMHFVFAFTRGKRFRVELYIDTGQKEKNKAIFDHLYTSRDLVHHALGEEIDWQRLNDKRASRIAWYRSGAITDDQKTLAQVQDWAVDAMARFYEALAGPAEQAIVVAEQAGR